MQRPSSSILGLVFRPRVILSAVAALSGLALSQSSIRIRYHRGRSGKWHHHVSSPVWVRAHNVGCDGLTPTSFGYSIDNGSTIIKGVTNYDIDTRAAISAGTHTIHYKSWVNGIACPVVSTTFTVGAGRPPAHRLRQQRLQHRAVRASRSRARPMEPPGFPLPSQWRPIAAGVTEKHQLLSDIRSITARRCTREALLPLSTQPVWPSAPESTPFISNRGRVALYARW